MVSEKSQKQKSSCCVIPTPRKSRNVKSVVIGQWLPGFEEEENLGESATGKSIRVSDCSVSWQKWCLQITCKVHCNCN